MHLDPATVWSHPLVAAVLGDSLHPGGTDLTLEMARAAGLPVGARVLDVGSGRGASARALAAGFTVHGVDVDADHVETARAAAHDAPGCTFQAVAADLADVAGAPFDAVLSECALCLTGDAAATLRRMRDLLRPGGVLLLSDVTVEPGAGGFRSAAALAACLGGARPRTDLVRLVEDAGFVVAWQRDCAAELAAVRDRVHARVDVHGLLRALGQQDGPLADLVREAEAAHDAGLVGYHALVARAPA